MREILHRLKWTAIRPQAFEVWNSVLAREHVPLEVLDAKQKKAQKTIVECAVKTTSFYRDLYAKSGFELEDMEHDGWFEKLPVVTKQDIKGHFEDFINPNQRRFLKVSTTGGSTGVPIKTGYDCRIPEEVYSWRLQNRFGVHPWDDHAYIWRDTRKSRLSKFRNALMWWPTRHLKLDASFSSIVLSLHYFRAM